MRTTARKHVNVIFTFSLAFYIQVQVIVDTQKPTKQACNQIGLNSGK